jgi:hypothetical protein
MDRSHVPFRRREPPGRRQLQRSCPDVTTNPPPEYRHSVPGIVSTTIWPVFAEVDLNRNHISWVSPLGRALIKSAAGDRVVLQAPGGTEYLTVLEVCYERISVEPFREPPGAEASANGLSRRCPST